MGTTLDEAATMTNRTKSKPAKPSAGAGKTPTSGSGTKPSSKPMRFKFIEPFCVTSQDGHPTQLGFNPSSKGAQNDPFIINTPTATKTDPNVRRFIRSHVMRGKNKKKTAGSKASSGKSAPTQQQRAGDLGRKSTGTPNMDSFCLRHNLMTLGQGPSAGSSSPSLPGTRQVVYSQWMPKPVGNDLAFVSFAEPLPQSKVNLLITAINYWREHMYPLSMCVSFQDCEKWIEYLSSDKAYVNSILFAAKCSAEAMENRGPGRESTVYLSKTLKFLQSNLNDKTMATTDTSIAVVVVLILTACGMGDIDEVGHHLGGMKHMIKLRGGVAQLAHTQMVQMKACRVDLSYALDRGEDPTLFTAEEIEEFWNRTSIAVEFREAHSRCPQARGVRKHDEKAREWRWSANPITNLARGAAIIPALCDGLPSDVLPDPNFIGRIQSLFDDLHEFANTCNLALRTGNKVTSGRFRDVLISTQYRLSRLEAQHAQGLKNGIVAESPLEIDILRVGMLVFGTVTFLHAEAVCFRYYHVAAKVRACLKSLSTALPDIIHQHGLLAQDPQSAAARASLQKLYLFLWFLFVVHFSTFVNPSNEDLLVGLVSDIFIAVGIKSPNGGIGQAIHGAGSLPPYSSSLFDMYPEPRGVPYASPSPFPSESMPPTFYTPSHRSSSPSEVLPLQPEYSYPPPPSSHSSADDWQPNTPPEQHLCAQYFPLDQESTSASTGNPHSSRDQSPSSQPLRSTPIISGGNGEGMDVFGQRHTMAPSPNSVDGSGSSTAAETTGSLFETLKTIPMETLNDYAQNTTTKSWDHLNEYSAEGVRVFRSHVKISASTHSWDESRDDPPLLYIWDILKDHLWVDWVHRSSGKVLAYKAFALGFGGYPLGQPGEGYAGEWS